MTKRQDIREPIPQAELKAFLKAHLTDSHKPYLLPTKKIMALTLLHASVHFQPHSFYVEGRLRDSLGENLVSKGQLTNMGKVVLALGAMRKATADSFPESADKETLLLSMLWFSFRTNNRELALGWIGQQQEGLKFLPKHTWVQARKFIVEGEM